MNKATLRILLILTTVGLISLLFPRGQKIDVQCSVGSVWSNPDFLAPLDFNASISEQEFLVKKKEINKNLPLYLKSNFVDKQKIASAVINANSSAIDQQAAVEAIINKAYNSFVIEKPLIDGEYILVNDEEKINFDPANAKTIDQLSKQLAFEFKSLGITLQQENNRAWKSKVEANVSIDNEFRAQLLENEFKAIDRKTHKIFKDQVLLRKGDIVSKQQAIIIDDLKASMNTGDGLGRYGYLFRFLGYFLLTVLIIGVLMLYVKNYFPLIFDNLRSLSFVLMWPLVFSLIVYGVSKNESLDYYLIPFCIVPIVIKNFYSERLALFVHIVVVLIASYLAKQGYEFTFLQILAGVVAVLFVSRSRFIDKFFRSILFIYLAYTLGYLGLAIINSSALEPSELPVFMWLAMNGVFLLMAYPLIPLIEKAFGFTSNITLAELSDMNNPLLKEMSLKAPGTLQHSLQVANLSEAAADKIGADSQLIKTAALYHDIGKMQRPEYFIENSSNSNPHEDLDDNFESAKIIIDHVIEGEKMAIKARLPKPIIDILKTHHGNSRVEYFYRNQINSEPDREFDETLFRYPGPKPVTREETIMMLADTIEAASKSLKSPTGKDIDVLVDKLVKHKIDDGQMEESKLSFSDSEECTKVFKTLLRSIYHVRIEYPAEVAK